MHMKFEISCLAHSRHLTVIHTVIVPSLKKKKILIRDCLWCLCILGEGWDVGGSESISHPWMRTAKRHLYWWSSDPHVTAGLQLIMALIKRLAWWAIFLPLALVISFHLHSSHPTLNRRPRHDNDPHLYPLGSQPALKCSSLAGSRICFHYSGPFRTLGFCLFLDISPWKKFFQLGEKCVFVYLPMSYILCFSILCATVCMYVWFMCVSLCGLYVFVFYTYMCGLCICVWFMCVLGYDMYVCVCVWFVHVCVVCDVCVCTGTLICVSLHLSPPHGLWNSVLTECGTR